MWANKGGPVRPDHVNVQFSVVPSSLNLARKVPRAPLAFGGTSLKVERFAEKTTPSSLSADNARLNAGTSSATNRNFFMCMGSPFLRLRKNSRKVVRGGRYIVGIPDLDITLDRNRRRQTSEQSLRTET